MCNRHSNIHSLIEANYFSLPLVITIEVLKLCCTRFKRS
jgi:hypothetical protein